MDWATYKARCDDPRVLSRWMLTRTAQWVEPPVAAALHDAMRARPVPKPCDHQGGPATDMFEVDLDAPTVAAILRCVERAAAAYVPGDRCHSGPAGSADPATPAPSGSLRAYLAAWREYRDAD